MCGSEKQIEELADEPTANIAFVPLAMPSTAGPWGPRNDHQFRFLRHGGRASDWVITGRAPPDYFCRGRVILWGCLTVQFWRHYAAVGKWGDYDFPLNGIPGARACNLLSTACWKLLNVPLSFRLPETCSFHGQTKVLIRLFFQRHAHLRNMSTAHTQRGTQAGMVPLIADGRTTLTSANSPDTAYYHQRHSANTNIKDARK